MAARVEQTLVRSGMPAAGGTWRQGLSGAIECGLVYGAACNVVSFLLPTLLHRVDGSGFFAVLSQAIAVVLVVVVGLVMMIALRIASIAKPAARRFEGEARSWLPGPLGLIAVAVAVASVEGQVPLLLSAGAAALVVIGLARTVLRDGRAGFLCSWAVAWALAVGPFLATARSWRAWGAWLAGGAALVAAALMLALAQGLARGIARRNPAPRRLAATRAVMTTAVVSLGLASAVLTQPRPPELNVARPGVRGAVRGATGARSVVLVVLDTVRADHLSAYGYPRATTPNLEQFWRDGATRYTWAFSASDRTLSSTGSLVTGLLPSRHGAHTRGYQLATGLRPTEPTLAELARKRGVFTAGVAANTTCLGPEYGFDRGYEFYDCRQLPSTLAVSAGVRQYHLAARLVRILADYLPVRLQAIYRPAEDVAAESIEVLKRISVTGRPFLLFVNFMDAHTPFLPPEPIWSRFSSGPRAFGWMTEYEGLHTGVARGIGLSADRRPYLESAYDGGIAYVDRELGRMFAEMKRLGLFDDTLIVVTSDHGELFGEHSALGHGAGAFRELVQVPLLIKYPRGVRPPCDQCTASGVDILPTIAEVIGMPVPAGLDGRSLLQRGQGQEVPAIAESFEDWWWVEKSARFKGDERAAFLGGRMLKLSRSGRLEREDNAAAEAPGGPLAPDSLLKRFGELAQMSVNPGVETDRREILDRLRALGYLGR